MTPSKWLWRQLLENQLTLLVIAREQANLEASRDRIEQRVKATRELIKGLEV